MSQATEPFVKVSVNEVPPIPAGANPFRHDAYHMGTSLTRGWIVMHEGPDRKESPVPLRYMILVNTRTGQRIKLDLIPEPEKEEKSV